MFTWFEQYLLVYSTKSMLSMLKTYCNLTNTYLTSKFAISNEYLLPKRFYHQENINALCSMYKFRRSSANLKYWNCWHWMKLIVTRSWMTSFSLHISSCKEAHGCVYQLQSLVLPSFLFHSFQCLSFWTSTQDATWWRIETFLFKYDQQMYFIQNDRLLKFMNLVSLLSYIHEYNIFDSTQLKVKNIWHVITIYTTRGHWKKSTCENLIG